MPGLGFPPNWAMVKSRLGQETPGVSSDIGEV